MLILLVSWHLHHFILSWYSHFFVMLIVLSISLRVSKLQIMTKILQNKVRILNEDARCTQTLF